MEPFKFQTGDIGFQVGEGLFSTLIKKITGGPFSHVFLVADEKRVFETDLAFRMAQYHDASKYDTSRRVVIARPKFLTEAHKGRIREICDEYDRKVKYSVWDCITNAIAAPFPENAKKKITASLGNKKFMKCDELTMNVIYNATKYAPFKKFESYEPNSLYRLCWEFYNDFEFYDRRVK